jgi:hypothetical protein
MSETPVRAFEGTSKNRVGKPISETDQVAGSDATRTVFVASVSRLRVTSAPRAFCSALCAALLCVTLLLMAGCNGAEVAGAGPPVDPEEAARVIAAEEANGTAGFVMEDTSTVDVEIDE